MSPAKKKVVITGLGIVTPGAKSAVELFSLIKNKQSTVKNHEDFEKLGFKTPIASILNDSELDFISQATNKTNISGAKLNRASKLALYAAGEALSNSKFDLTQNSRKGVFVGCNRILLDIDDLKYIAKDYDRDKESLNFDAFLKQSDRLKREKNSMDQDQPAHLISEQYNFQDVVFTHGDACAAGNISIGTAYRHIQNDQLDIAIAGGVETLANPMGYFLFSLINALYSGSQNNSSPAECSRPFDSERCGLVMGEGSAFVILESEEHAKNRNADILCEVKGFYKATEAVRITSSSLDGSEYARCMKGALDDAGLAVDSVQHINAHGTSTVLNDLCEAKAIDELFSGSFPFVTSNKAAIGHTFGASGAIEAVLSVMSLKKQEVLPTLNYSSPKKDEPLLNILTGAKQCSIDNVLSNSFGFCGSNSSIILGMGSTQ